MELAQQTSTDCWGHYVYKLYWMLSSSFVIRWFILLLTSTIITSYTITSSLSGFYWSHQTWACAGTDSLLASVLCHGQCPRWILPSSASVRLVHKAILVIGHGNLVNCPVNRRRWINVGSTSQTVDQHWTNVSCFLTGGEHAKRKHWDPGLTTSLSQQSRDVEPMLGQCWPAVYDVGPTLTQHWSNVSCLLGTTQMPLLWAGNNLEMI